MSHDDFKFEPVPGLPEALPKGEVILWQGRPAVWRLAREAFKVHWVAAYFAVIAIWRVTVSTTVVPFGEAMTHAIPFLLVGLVACGILVGLAAIQSRSTIYTLTNKRVGLRIGAALTMTLNLPYVQIKNAEAALNKDGTGTIAFKLPEDVRISYLMSWPHVRPWRWRHTEPALRAIPDAAAVAKIFADAAETRLSEPQLTRSDAPGYGGATVAAE